MHPPLPSRSLATTLRAAGEPVLISATTGWRPIGRFSLQSLPGAASIEPSLTEVRQVLWRSGRLVALHAAVSAPDPPLQRFVAHRSSHGPGSQQRQFRQQVRAGLQRGGVEPCAWSDLGHAALAVNRAAWAAGRSEHRRWCHHRPWQRFCQAMEQDPAMSAWGFWLEGRMAAFLILWQPDRTAYGLALQWDPALAWAHPTHCLWSEVLRQLFASDRCDRVIAGRQTIPSRPDLERFKRHAGFRPEPCPLRVVPHPLLAPWFRGRRRSVWLSRLAERFPRTGIDLAPLEVLARACLWQEPVP